MSTKRVEGGGGEYPQQPKVQKKGVLQTRNVTEKKGESLQKNVPKQNPYKSGSTHPVNAKPVTQKETGLWGLIQKIVQFIKSIFSSTKQTAESDSGMKMPKVENEGNKYRYKLYKEKFNETYSTNIESVSPQFLRGLDEEIIQTRKDLGQLIPDRYTMETLSSEMKSLALRGQLSDEMLEKREQITIKSTALFETLLNQMKGGQEERPHNLLNLQKEWAKKYPEIYDFVDINRLDTHPL